MNRTVTDTELKQKHADMKLDRENFKVRQVVTVSWTGKTLGPDRYGL